MIKQNYKFRKIGSLVAVAALMLSVLVGFTSCNIYTDGGAANNNQNTPENDKAPTVNIDDELDLPSYIQELIQLDEVFKY